MTVRPPRPKGPPFTAMRAFEAAARLGGFVPAAEELNVTAGAVSQHIKALEGWAGVALFHRLAGLDQNINNGAVHGGLDTATAAGGGTATASATASSGNFSSQGHAESSSCAWASAAACGSGSLAGGRWQVAHSIRQGFAIIWGK